MQLSPYNYAASSTNAPKGSTRLRNGGRVGPQSHSAAAFWQYAYSDGNGNYRYTCELYATGLYSLLRNAGARI